ncbi:MAG: TonB-dependent receptor plug domain-containing protein, partial [Pseudomonadota bacterium]
MFSRARFYPVTTTACCLFFAASNATAASPSFEGASDEIERISVYADQLFQDTTKVSPTSVVTEDVLEAINLITSEDAVAYEPSLVIRRRYVGDPNGVIGIRGSGMFQTARSLVFADGLPLHYLLQTRFSGSPRWSLVGPDEIQTAEVIYGPFSAEYSGNSMGGVVNITTKNPQTRRFVAQGTLISQDYNELGTEDNFNGNRVYFAYEDVVGNLGWFVSYNRLNNKSQPMTNYFVSADNAQLLEDQGVSGFIEGLDDNGESVIYIGDSGAETSVTDLYKAKFVYTLNNAEIRATIAYEERTRDEDDKRNYLIDASGNA